MPRKIKYKDVYIPERWVPLLNDALSDPIIKRKLLLRDLPNTPQGVAKLIIQEFLESRNKNEKARNEQQSSAQPQTQNTQNTPAP